MVIQTVGMFARPFYFLRHGETEANARGVISGTLDVELTTLGRRQAEAAARTLAAESITAVYSSPLRRARETAATIAKALGLSVEIVPELVERRRGEQEGKPHEARIDELSSVNVEAFETFVQRVLKGLSQVDSQVPVVVAHLGVFRVLCQTLEITAAEGMVGNALPLRFVPLGADRWKLEALPIEFSAASV